VILTLGLAATAFSLLGQRQLFFLVEGLLERLPYLFYGLAAILAFIEMKLVLHALRENRVPFINDGQPGKVVEITTLHSLLGIVGIVGILALTVLPPLLSPKGKAKDAVSRLRQRLAVWQGLAGGAASASEREAAHTSLVDAERAMRALPERYRTLIHERQTLHEMLAEAHARQAAAATGDHESKAGQPEGRVGAKHG
jgi:tellurite resistance protein TerC